MLQSLKLCDFTLFGDARFEFGALNVIHGENSSGKTHLLKLAYSMTSALSPEPNESPPAQPTKAWLEPRLGAKLSGVFRPDKGRIGRLARRVQGTSRSRVEAHLDDTEKLAFSFGTRSDRTVSIEAMPGGWLPQPPIYLPTRELLSVYPGFASLYATQAVPFDETWRDTCLLLGARVARGPKKREIADLLHPFEQAMGCKAILEDDRFFLQMSEPNAKVEADLVAEGYRKLAMVARLIANGSLDDKAYLFWDEPEANLNPRLVKRLAPLLVALARGGVQVFIATHSLFLMRELAIQQGASSEPLNSRYFGLTPREGRVDVAQGPELDDSGDIAALDENLEQADRYMKMLWRRDEQGGQAS